MTEMNRQGTFKEFQDMIEQPCLAGTKDKVIVVDRDEKVLDKDQIMKNLKCQAREGFGPVS